jgi:hypothetical protein
MALPLLPPVIDTSCGIIFTIDTMLIDAIVACAVVTQPFASVTVMI